MTKKIILTTILLSTFSIFLSACSPTSKLKVDVNTNSDLEEPSYSENTPNPSAATPTAAEPTTLSDEQLLLQMESESDTQIDQEFSRLNSELE